MPSSAEIIWNAAQDQLRALLKPEIFTMWFAPLRAVSLEGTTLHLGAHDDFAANWLTDNYSDILRTCVTRSAGQPTDVVMVAAPELVPAPASSDVPLRQSRPEGANGTSGEAPVTQARSGGRMTSSNGLKPADLGFNPNNTFETFVVGNNNELAHGAALAVAQSPGKTYNPLFLFGGVGLGKTHLLHAVGQYVFTHRRNARVAYVSCERFTNEFIEGLQNNQLPKFRKKYRMLDLLLIDDVQFLGGKERIQEEFFHTFNALHENRKQIILTCDRPASDISGLEQRLVSRFEWGLVADLQTPDVETRLAILRKKEKQHQFELSDEVRNFLAQRIRTNIRRLEGAFVRVMSLGALTQRSITVESVESLLREILQEEGRQTLSIEMIQKRVADHYDIRLADMTSKRRPENIAFPRQVAMFLARQLTESSLNVIGDAFGGRDHGTVLHACRAVRDRMETDSSVRQTVSYLEKLLSR